jgi:hypothetical protein
MHRPHRHFAKLIAYCLGCIASTAGAVAESQTFDYDILRNGKPVGSHQILVESRDDSLHVVARSRIDIGWLGFSFYQLDYAAEEEWDAQGLRRLQVAVNNDGEQLYIDGHRRNARFYWQVNGAAPKHQPMPVFPTNHWNPAVLSQQQVLNTLTGGINQVSITAHGEPAPGFAPDDGEIGHFRYQGELALDAWYDASGRWLGMRFAGRDGSRIEYRCRNCQTGGAR